MSHFQIAKLSTRAAGLCRAVTVLCLSLGSLLSTVEAAPVPLAKAKADDLRDRFEKRQKETRTWTANFSQALSMPGLKAPVLSEGTIRFRAPDGLRIDFSKPAGEYVLVIGDRLFIQKVGKKLVEKSLSNDSAG